MMKKWLIILVSFFLLTMAACSNTESDSGKKEQSETAADTQSSSQQASSTDEAKTKEDSQSVDTDSASAQYEEYPVIKEQIKHADQLEASVATDNPNKRVLLFKESSGVKKYKTIFIKQKSRLKIIELDDNGLIYDQTI